jgi:nitrite reductase/ring-hydroxylating ferredoxin subunit
MTNSKSERAARPAAEDANCSACTLDGSRRQFLRDTAAAIAGIVAVLGIPDRADALMVRVATATLERGRKASYPVPAEDGVSIDRDREVILVRWQSAIYAFRLSCPHQKTVLKWKEEDRRFQCPKHKSKYEPDGTFISGRATRGMDRYRIARRGKEIEIDLSTVYREDEQKAEWTAAVVKV